MMSRWRGRRPVFYGWIVAGVAALGVFLSGPGQTYSVSTFINPLLEETGWSRSLVSSLYSAGTLIAGFTMILVGRMADTRGYRVMMTLVALAFAGALMFMSTVTTPLALFFGFLMIRTFGQGSLTLIPYSLVPQWFMTNRGKALSLLAAGSALSAALLPPLNVVIIENLGWRALWVFWSLVLAGVMAPVAWSLTRNRPEDMGLRPDGLAGNLRDGSASGRSEYREEYSWTLGQAVATAPFWILLVVTCIPSMVGTGAQFHHMSIMEENGVSLAAAAAVFTVTSVTRLLMTPLAGSLCDRLPVRRVLASTLVVESLSLLLLLVTRTTAMAIALGVILGLRLSFVVILGGMVWPHFFGRRHLASIRGLATSGMVVGSALGPLPFGVAYDYFGGYTEIIVIMALMPLAGAVASVFLTRPAPPEAAKPAASWAEGRE